MRSRIADPETLPLSASPRNRGYVGALDSVERNAKNSETFCSQNSVKSFKDIRLVSCSHESAQG
jgi:hypothetical protein